MEADPLRLVETLRERRRRAGLTRTRLAALSGVESALIARFERGDAHPTSAQARALRVALTGEDEPPAPSGESARAEPVAPLPQAPPRPGRPAPRPVEGLVAAPPPARRSDSRSDPAPLVSYDPDVRVYSAAPTRYPTEDDRRLYLLRRIRTAVILLGLLLVLWWAVEALQEGFGDVIDLFRAPTTTLGGA